MSNTAARRSRTRFARATLPLALAALLAAPAPLAFAQDAPAPAAPAESTAEAPVQPASDAVVATVGGEAITEGDLTFAAEDLGQELANIPEADRRAFLVTVLIDMKVMAQAARGQGLDKSDVFQQRLGYLEDRAL